MTPSRTGVPCADTRGEPMYRCARNSAGVGRIPARHQHKGAEPTRPRAVSITASSLRSGHPSLLPRLSANRDALCNRPIRTGSFFPCRSKGPKGRRPNARHTDVPAVTDIHRDAVRTFASERQRLVSLPLLRNDDLEPAETDRSRTDPDGTSGLLCAIGVTPQQTRKKFRRARSVEK
jgi:hypothetical protein